MEERTKKKKKGMKIKMKKVKGRIIKIDQERI